MDAIDAKSFVEEQNFVGYEIERTKDQAFRNWLLDLLAKLRQVRL